MSQRTTFVLVYLALMLLLASTIGVAQLELGFWNPVLNLTIATIKAALIVWFFMHLREVPGIVRLAALGGVLWLAIMFGLSLADWLTRTSHPY